MIVLTATTTTIVHPGLFADRGVTTRSMPSPLYALRSPGPFLTSTSQQRETGLPNSRLPMA
jgi:hypothetical protein